MYGSGSVPEVSEDQECCCCCSLTQLTWVSAREGGRQRRVCVCLFFPPQYEIRLLSSAIGTAFNCLVTKSPSPLWNDEVV